MRTFSPLPDVLGGTVVDADIVFAVNGVSVKPLHLCEWGEGGRPATYDEFVRHLVRDFEANIEHPGNPLRLLYEGLAGRGPR